ncbi:phage tail spike protein [Clostridium celatum]|uniref:Phage minor structural protein n=1 Tax=Clostridium celatum DSM 1785 TaxID=545697 RepID=L1QKG1_9CLOT|nr:phage tail spike protein [Clostridium celatum]EKY28067.1 phage minor structural protein [Clostridium celatum DSM 1785]MCE9654170.1 phage tail protein [Clostridium celatum]
MLCIYDKKTIKGNFDNNGLGVLNEPILAEVTEELNGQYYLEIEYPANSKKAIYLKEFNIIKADNQLFRIYKVEKVQSADKRVKAYANHIYYDLANYFIEDERPTNASVKTAMQKAMISDLSTIYSVDSDIIIPNTLYMVELSPAEAMFKIIDRWGQGELVRDNYDIKILKQRGEDNGVLIKYGKNISGLKITIDTTDVVTKIYPKGANGIRLYEKYINVPNWDSDLYPPFPIIKKVEIKEAEDEVTLRKVATELAKTIGLSSINIQVDFIELSKSREYLRFKDLEKVNVGDIVTVRHSEFDIDVKVKVIKIKKDLLTGINTKVELGQPLGDFLKSMDPAALIKSATDELGNQVAQALTSMLYYGNPLELTVSTTEIQPMYLGVSAVSNTNLALNVAISCIASSECTLTIKIELDNVEIPFKPKQKLHQGDNVIGIPLGIPQVSSGAHYVGIYLKTDTGTVKIPIYNMQCMIDGRNLQGGLSSELPHAEVKQEIQFVRVDTNLNIGSAVDILFNDLVNKIITEEINYFSINGEKASDSCIVELN